MTADPYRRSAASSNPLSWNQYSHALVTLLMPTISRVSSGPCVTKRMTIVVTLTTTFAAIPPVEAGRRRRLRLNAILGVQILDRQPPGQ